MQDFERRRRGGDVDGTGDSSDDDDSDVDTANDARVEAELDMLWREYKARHTKKGVKFKPHESKGREKRTELGAGELNDDSGDEASPSDSDEPATTARERATERDRKQARDRACLKLSERDSGRTRILFF